MKRIYFVLLLLSISNLYAGNLSTTKLDSLYNLYVSGRANSQAQQPAASTEYIKCGFGLVSLIRENINSFSTEQQNVLKKLLQRPTEDASIVTPGGFFRIHYNTSGSDMPRYFTDPTKSDAEIIKMSLDSLAVALDSSYNFEVGYLGYPPPPPDNGEGGDDLYDIYVINMGSDYGVTNFEFPDGGKGPSYMEIDNDYSYFPTKGINAARVTVAHEFHHAIQLGNYIFRSSDRFFYELTSTSMEEFVFNTINDYYNYLSDYFFSPNKAFAKYDGYELAPWNLFLKSKYGYDIIKKQWELMPKMRALLAIQNSLVDEGTTFGKEYNEFGIWTYFTGYRANLSPTKHFDEGKNYPLLKAFTTITFNSSLKAIKVNAMATSDYLINFVNPDNADTLSAIITNGDYNSGIDSLNKLFSAEYDLSSSSIRRWI